MASDLKEKILSLISIYVSTECFVFTELKKAIEDISDEKFTDILKQQSPSCLEDRLAFLLDEIIFFINRHYQIKHEEGIQLDHLLNEIKRLCMCGRSGNISLYTRRASRPYMMPDIPLSIL